MLLVDTGVLYALADRDDAWHRPSVDLLRAARDRWLVPVTVLPEAAYLIHNRLGADAERRFVRSIVNQELAVESIAAADWTRGAELLDRYLDIGLVDATVVAIAERLRLSTIATTDRRHFSTIRPRHRQAFVLVP
jgi:uncharacterized protein